MPPSIPRHQLISGSRATALGTLASRVLGMLRDMATAAILGLSGGGVMDAFVLAFRIPNTFRRLFGEGALAASYLPVISAELERQPHRAWKLASVLFAHLAGLLLFLVLAGEAALGVLALAFDSPEIRLFASLAAVMLPYMLLICLAAQASATLHALGHFALPALVPTILNVVWLVAAMAVAPWISPDKAVQAHVLAVAILIAGVLQLAVQIPLLRARGFRFDYDPRSAREKFTLILKAMGPMTVGLMITQINSLIDSLVAWLLSSPSPDGGPISWLGGRLDYPMAQGAVGALYYAERLYQFPLGILGLAVATAIFPLLSRHAARNDQPRFSQDLTLGLRLVLFLGVPASAGLVLLAEPLARLLFQHREFTSQDALRTARVIAGYSWGVWAYCALPVIVRAYYALGDRITPIRIGTATVALDFTLNLVLIWFMAETGLAISTSIGASLQVVVLAVLFSRRKVRLGWPSLAATSSKTIIATALMSGAAVAAIQLLPHSAGLTGRLLDVVIPLAIAVAVYLAAARFLKIRELGLLFAWGAKAE